MGNDIIPFLLQCSSLYFFFSPFSRSPFPVPPPLFIYLYLPHILTIHSYLTSFFFDTCYLSHLKKMVAGICLVVTYTIQVTSSFNAADKAIIFQLMRMQRATPSLKLPYYPLSSTLFKS